jgi:dsDNA-specific endonuclease/ATPase MutS2
MDNDDDSWDKVIAGIKPLKNKKINYHLPKNDLQKTCLKSIKERRINETLPNIEIKNINVNFVSEKYFKRKNIEAKIDLHGCTRKEAGFKLDQFFYQSQIKGLKTVLVISGKGNSLKDDGSSLVQNYGILRSYTCEWLQNNPSFVVCYSEAKPNDGGKGAFYVHVRGIK